MVEKTKNLLSMIISGCAMVTLVLTTVFCLVTPESIRKSPNSLPTDVATSSAVSANPLIKAGGAVDADVFAALLAKVDPLYASDSKKQMHLGELNGGNPVTVKLFEDKLPAVVNGKVFDNFLIQDWQAVYRTGNVLTLWMANPYTSCQFYADLLVEGIYEDSDLRSILLSTYDAISGAFGLDSHNYVVAPKDLPVKWQTGEPQLDRALYYSSGTEEHYSENNLMDGKLESDKLWLPSFAEIGNNSITTTFNSDISNLNVRNGLWQTNYRDREFNFLYYYTDGPRVWLRSSSVGGAPLAYGWDYFEYTYNSMLFDVRPALHLDLSALQESVNNVPTNSLNYEPLFKEGGKISPITLNQLLEKVGGMEPSNSKNCYNLPQINLGNPVIVKLFNTLTNTTNDINLFTSKYWQVVYRTGNILTLWMVEPYTENVFNSTLATGSNYVGSDIQKLLINTYATLDTAFNLNNKNYISTPAQLPIAWQTDPEKQFDETRCGMEGNSITTQNNLMKEGSRDEKLWLPSIAEVYNNTTTESTKSGLWQINYRDLIWNDQVDDIYSCWLRASNGSDACTCVCYTNSYSASVDGLAGVRPALHLNLETLAAAIPVPVDFTLTSESYGIGTGLDSEETDFNYTVAVRDSAGKLVFSLPISNMTPINITITLNRDEKYTIDLYGPSAVAFSFGMGDLMFATPHLEFTAGALTTVKIIPVKHDSTWSGGTDIL